MKNKLLGYYNYTVVLTYIGMLFGFTGITFVMDGRLQPALLCLMLAGVCDMFDGAIASTRERTQQEKFFGIQIDSLSDLICFCVLPALFVYQLGQGSMPAFAVACMYVLCGLIRLSFFNVDEQERQLKSTEGRKVYFGMPVTLSALILPLVCQISVFFKIRMAGMGIGALLFMGIMFLLPFQLKKPKFIGKICVVICGLAELLALVFAVGDI